MFVQSHDGFIYLLPALPDVWKNGSVTGLVALGGFVIDMDWKDGKVTYLKIHSRYGGNCRLRVAAPLKGNGIKTAKGENTNALYAVPVVKTPLISEKANLIVPKNSLEKTTYLYDLKTDKEGIYVFGKK
jgi:alpha-L-fucosidase 2